MICPCKFGEIQPIGSRDIIGKRMPIPTGSTLKLIYVPSYLWWEEIIWLVGCFGLYGPLRQYFSLYRAVSQREGERRVK